MKRCTFKRTGQNGEEINCKTDGCIRCKTEPATTKEEKQAARLDKVYNDQALTNAERVTKYESIKNK
jgi:hypothetical protein